MAAPRESGRGIFGLVAPTRERTTTPVLPRPAPQPETTPVSPEPGKPPGKKPLIQRLAGNLAVRVILAGTALAGTGYAGYEAYQGNIPGIHRSVDQSVSKDTVFDNNATKGVVGPNNILVVPREVFDKTPIADAQGNPIFDFPWDKNHPIAIRYHKAAIGDKEIAWLKSGGLANAEDYRGYQSGMNSDNFLPTGYEFPNIYPGRLFFMGSVYDEEASRKSPSNPYGLAVYSGPVNMAKVEFIAPNGILYFVNINIVDDSGGVEKLLPISPLVNAPLIGPENGNGQDWEKGTLVENLQKIFSTTQQGKLKMIIQGGKNGRLNGPNAESVPGDFKFKIGTDTTGTPKILVRESK